MERMLLEFAIRTTLIAAATAAALWMLRIKTAPARHAAWSGVMLAMLLLPMWMTWGPKASLPVLPPVLPVAQAQTARLTAAAPEETASPQQALLAAPAATPRWSGSIVFIGLYLLGAGALLLRLALGTILANRLTSSSCVAPVTVGLFNPRIILPECWTEWPQAQREAVLTHEREHVRRRDPLTHWLALFNRAVFWFHPLAWWLEQRLSALAEESCDAAVLAQGYDAAEYSGYLLDLARSVGEAGKRVNVVAMAMPGSALPRRIRNLAAGIRPAKISRMRLTFAALACVIPAVVFAAGTLAHAPQILPLRPLPSWPLPQPPVLIAQAPAAPKPEFEAATVKPAAAGVTIPFQVSGGPGTNDPGRIVYTNISMHQLLTIAYGAMQPDLLLGLSTAEENAQYDVSATIPAGATKEQLSVMLQNLLVRRFHLQVHRETQDKPEYELVAAPGGFKMKETQLAGGAISFPVFNFNGGVQIFRAVSSWAIANACRNYLHRAVVDKTGLNGKYDVTLDFARDPAGGGPDIFSAMEQQLGLRLQPITTTLALLVVDHLDNLPAAN